MRRKIGAAICAAVIGFFGVYAVSGADFLNDQQKTAARAEQQAQEQAAQQQNHHDKDDGRDKQNNQQQAAGISADEAKSIALKDANRKASEVQHLKSKAEKHSGIAFYEVEFHADDKEYSYAIDASSGEVLGRKFELDESRYGHLLGSRLSEQQLKKMLLERMKDVDEADIKYELKRDDGLMMYEGRASSASMKYEFKIDSATGTTVEWREEQKK